MTTDELLFFGEWPSLIGIYEALKSKLESCFPEMTVKVSKTQISFFGKYMFAMVSLPVRRKKDWPKEFLMVSFGLDYEKAEPGIALRVQARKNRWTHHVLVENPEGLDDRLMEWLQEAYEFAQRK